MWLKTLWITSYKFQILRRLQIIKLKKKLSKWIWYELSEESIGQHFTACISCISKHEERSFLWKIVIGDEKWIYYDNPKCQESRVSPREFAEIAAKPNHFLWGEELLLNIWWDMKCVLYYVFLKLCKTAFASRYKCHL